MADREMLELAAKAYGFGSDSGGFIWTESEYPRGSSTNGALWNYKGWRDTAELWNPLTDDGDALRLAIACQLGISIVGGRAGLVECVSFKQCHCFVSSREIADDGDVCAATRRAIVRAAAEIGAQM